VPLFDLKFLIGFAAPGQELQIGGTTDGISMDLRLYDTLTREKRTFVPLDPANVRMYVCGPTVYDFAHIGNARPVIVFDVLFRLLRRLYGEGHVTYVRNITDVDDKINDRATRDFPGLPLNEAIRKVTEKTAAQFHADVAALGCLPPTFEPRATDFVLPRADGKTDMVTLIKRLIARGHAYEAGGEVLFDTQSMPDYGALSGRKLDEQLAGARVAVEAHKKNPADFVLWKQSSGDEPGWESPWGRGRPGWHIECSAMSAAYLGDVFDIHGGGLDLIFPHHENEIAQSRCAHGTSVMANYWMHNGFLEVDGKKMSKSEGNFVTLRDLLENWRDYSWPSETLRFNMLRTHYRQPIDWTFESLNESHNILCDWYDDLKGLQSDSRISPDALRWLSDDLNTPRLIVELHKLRKNKLFQPLLNTLQLLGFSGKRETLLRTAFVSVNLHARATLRVAATGELRATEAPDEMQARIKVVPSNDEIEQLISARTAARARKDFKESDRIRDQLAAMGVVIKDSKEGTTWEFAR
jgi:cysteinyl-tRNA synthetase